MNSPETAGGPGHHHHDANRGAGGVRIFWAILINVGITAAEAVAGFLTGSLALLSDAVHNLSDVVALALSYAGAKMERKAPTPTHSYGLGRAEVFVGLVNAVTLVVITAWIFYEAYLRLLTPRKLPGITLLAVGFVGVTGNLASVLVLRGGRKEKLSLNVRSAVLHLVLDALSAVGVMAAAAVIMLTGWHRVDPLVSVLIGIVILAGSVSLIREAVHVLMEGVPPGIRISEVRETICGVSGVKGVHDLHIWSITSTYTAMSAHVVVHEDDIDSFAQIRADIVRRLKEVHSIDHCTLQPETVPCAADDPLCAGPGSDGDCRKA